MHSNKFPTIVALTLAILGLTSTSRAQDQDFETWLNAKIHAAVDALDLKTDSGRIAANANSQSPSKQTETASMASSSTTLVDSTSFSDFVGAALNLANLNVGDEGDSESSFSTTISGYGILAGIEGVDPLDPVFYNAHPGWRKVAIMLGYEGQREEQGQVIGAATLIGVKFVAINGREISQNADFDRLLDAQGIAADAFNTLSDAIEDIFWQEAQKSGTPLQKDDFSNETLAKGPQFAAFLNGLDPTVLDRVDGMIANEISPFKSLKARILEKVQDIQKRPQLSFSFNTSQREGGTDLYSAEGIFEKGFAPGIDFKANAAFNYRNNQMVEDFRGGSVGVSLNMSRSQVELENPGRDSLSLAFSSSASWMTHMKPSYKGQVKLTIPIAKGVNLPLSVTAANRTELIDESDVIGQVGFTFDVSQLLKP